MKNIIIIILALSFANVLTAQAPEKFPYQAAFRDAAGLLLNNSDIKIRFTIKQSNVTGAIVYQEIWTTTTSDIGLVKVDIGGGDPVSGTLGDVAWGSDTYFLEIAYDPAGGTTFQELGSTQLMSVPFALHASVAERAAPKTKTERDNLSTPLVGQLLFCTDCGAEGELQVYNGTRWTNLIGQDPAE